MAESPSLLTNLLKQGVSILLYGTLIAAGVAALQYILDSKRDLRERTLHFHELILKADELYCQTEAEGVQVRTRAFIDRAAKLEPEIADELISLDYTILAAVGSSFWSHDRAHGYGMRALQLGTENGDLIESYAANIVLAHIDFTEYKSSSEPEYLNEAREHFTQAKLLVTEDTSRQNLHFAGQLYVLWGQHELFSGNVEVSEKLFALAERAFRALPHNESSVYKISLAKQTIKDGIPPRLPCPSQITVSPPLRENPDLAETQRRESKNENSSPSRAPEPDAAENVQLNERISKIEGSMDSLDGKFSDELANLRSLLKDAGGPENREPETPRPLLPDEPQHGDNDGWVPSPGTREPQTCAFKIFNNTSYAIRPMINGFDKPEYNIPAGKVMQFNCGCNGWLHLKHRHNNYQTGWPPSIFWKTDGSRAVPLIEMTTCCFVLRNL